MHSAPYFTAFGLLAVVLAARVIVVRRKHRISVGHGDLPELEIRMRIFGNFIEYAPLGLVLLIGLEFVQAPVWYLHLAGMTLLLGRLMHAMGLSRDRGASPGRVAGMVLTLTSLTISAVGVTLFSFLGP